MSTTSPDTNRTVRRTVLATRPLTRWRTVDLLKRSGPIRNLFDLIFWTIQTLSSRDCFAFLFMVLIILGLAHVALGIFASVGTIWIVYVIGSLLLPGPRARYRGAA